MNMDTEAVAPRAKGVACAVSCSNCCLRAVCLPCGLETGNLGAMDELTRVKRRILKGSALYRSGDAFVSLFAVRSGATLPLTPLAPAAPINPPGTAAKNAVTFVRPPHR